MDCLIRNTTGSRGRPNLLADRFFRAVRCYPPRLFHPEALAGRRRLPPVPGPRWGLYRPGPLVDQRDLLRPVLPATLVPRVTPPALDIPAGGPALHAIPAGLSLLVSRLDPYLLLALGSPWRPLHSWWPLGRTGWPRGPRRPSDPSLPSDPEGPWSDPRKLAGNPDSPQVVIFLTSIIDVIRGC